MYKCGICGKMQQENVGSKKITLVQRGVEYITTIESKKDGNTSKVSWGKEIVLETVICPLCQAPAIIVMDEVKTVTQRVVKN